MVSGHLCRGRRPRRPAEGASPLPTMQNSNGRRRKVAGRACPAPTGWWKVDWVLAGRGGRHICRPDGVNRQVSYNRKRCGRDESLPYGPGRQRLPSQTCGPGMPGPYAQAYCNIHIPNKHHYISKEVLPAPLSFFVVSCYNILCIVMYKIYRERYLFITHAAFEKL